MMTTKRSRILMAAACVTLLVLAGGLYARTTQPSAQPQVGAAPANPAPAPAPGAPANAGAPASQPGQQGGQRGADPFGGPYIWVVLLGGFFLLYWWSSRGRKKQEQKRKEMLSNLKKGDKITSIGGIVGSVVEVRDDEVTVKVDETNNVRMKFARWAIRGVGEEAKTEGPDDKK